jgi:hypothetical protein
MKLFKWFLVVVIFTVGIFSYADEQPAYLKDAKIAVTLTNGKVYMFDANEFKVVPRDQDEPECAIADAEVKELKEYVHRSARPDRMRLMMGMGPAHSDVTQLASTVVINNSYIPVAGFGYDHILSAKEGLSVNGSLYTNGTVSLGLGVDF